MPLVGLYRCACSGSASAPHGVRGFRFFLGGNHASGVGLALSRARKLRRKGVHDQFDVTLEDQDLLREVELTTNLIIAASETDEHLTLEEIDQILGVERQGA